MNIEKNEKKSKIKKLLYKSRYLKTETNLSRKIRFKDKIRKLLQHYKKDLKLSTSPPN